MYPVTLIFNGLFRVVVIRSRLKSHNCEQLFFYYMLLKVLMGILYKIETITLLEDVEAEEYDDYEDFIKKTQENYSTV